jgi:N-acetylglucosaminyl-diphospho-decaprenol L-rhamnosyltransferase
MTSIAVVIVNYRTADLAIDCLRSIQAHGSGPWSLRTIVVDNNSLDGSAERMRAAIQAEGWAWARVVALDTNGGYAAGNNAGIRVALVADTPPDYVVLLNPDTVVRPAAIERLIEFMERHPRAGIAGALLETAEGELQPSSHNAPSPLGELEVAARMGILSRAMARSRVTPPLRLETHECEWVSGACLVVRREVVENIGMLDEGFFLYFEEVDFCLRARSQGWTVHCVPAARVMHLEGGATRIRDARQPRPAYWFESRRRFFVRYYGALGLALADVCWLVGRGSLAVRRALGLGRGGDLEDPRRFARDLVMGDVRALLPRRMRQRWRHT